MRRLAVLLAACAVGCGNEAPDGSGPIDCPWRQVVRFAVPADGIRSVTKYVVRANATCADGSTESVSYIPLIASPGVLETACGSYVKCEPSGETVDFEIRECDVPGQVEMCRCADDAADGSRRCAKDYTLTPCSC